MSMVEYGLYAILHNYSMSSLLSIAVLYAT